MIQLLIHLQRRHARASSKLYVDVTFISITDLATPNLLHGRICWLVVGVFVGYNRKACFVDLNE